MAIWLTTILHPQEQVNNHENPFFFKFQKHAFSEKHVPFSLIGCLFGFAWTGVWQENFHLQQLALSHTLLFQD